MYRERPLNLRYSTYTQPVDYKRRYTLVDTTDTHTYSTSYRVQLLIGRSSENKCDQVFCLHPHPEWKYSFFWSFSLKSALHPPSPWFPCPVIRESLLTAWLVLELFPYYRVVVIWCRFLYEVFPIFFPFLWFGYRLGRGCYLGSFFESRFLI